MRCSPACAVIALLLNGTVQADTAKDCESKCAASEKLTKLVASWKAIGEAAKDGCPEEAAKLAREISAVARECPFGSRMGETMAFVKAALESAIAADQACTKSCPIASGSKEGSAPTPACAEGSKLMEARSKLLASLKELADHAACAASSSCAETKACGSTQAPVTAKAGLCESKAAAIVAKIRAEECCKSAARIVMQEIDGLKCEQKAGEIATAVREDKCEQGAAQILIKAAQEACGVSGKAAGPARVTETATCTVKPGEGCAKGGTCCMDLMARGAALKASWEKAPAEMKGMCPQKRKELMATAGALAQRSKAMALMPETVLALAEGFETLESIHGGISKWASANAEALKDVPCESKKAFEAQNALLSTTGGILTTVKRALGACSIDGISRSTQTSAAK